MWCNSSASERGLVGSQGNKARAGWARDNQGNVCTRYLTGATEAIQRFRIDLELMGCSKMPPCNVHLKREQKGTLWGFLLSAEPLQSGELVNVGLVWPCHSVSVNKEHASIGSQGGLHLKLKLRTELAFPWQGSIFWIKTCWPKYLRSWEASVHFNPLPEQGVSSDSELQRRTGACGLQGSRFQGYCVKHGYICWQKPVM